MIKIIARGIALAALLVAATVALHQPGDTGVVYPHTSPIATKHHQ